MSKKPTYKDLEQRIKVLEETVKEAGQLQDKIHESKEKFRALADSTPVAVMLFQDDRWISVNRAAETITGYPISELLMMNFWENVHPDYKALIQERGQKRQRGEETTDRYECKIITKDGTEKWVDLSGTSTIVGGRPAGLVSMVDISKRKRAEEVLRESEERYRSLFESTLDGIMLTQQDGTILAANRRSCEMFLMTEEELLLTGRAGIVVDDERLRTALTERAKKGKWQAELTARRSDGLTFPVEVSSSIFIGADGKEMTAMVIRDITERKQAEEKLARLSLQNELVLNSAAEGILGVDLQGKHTFVNSAAAKMLGYEIEELIGRPSHSTWHHTKPNGSPYPQEECEILAAHLEGTVRRVSTEVFWRKDGASFPVEYASTPIYEKGRTTGVVVTFADITERKHIESYREMSNEILQILSKPGTLHDLVQNILTALKVWTGFDAVGIRLGDGDDFPYFTQDGFSNEFLLTENTLTERGVDGGVCRDKDGNVNLECTCGLVISGKADPANPLFTKGGSFWTNDSFPLLDLPSDQDPRLHPRNECIYQGYASVALIPIRTKDQIVGLLQFNDRRKNCFSLAAIEQFESISANIGEALLRKAAEDALKKSEEQMRLLLNSTAEAIYGTDLQDNCTFANPACLRMLGYAEMEQLLGKNMHNLIHHSYPNGSPMAVEVCKIYQAFREGKGVHVDDEVLWRADGNSFPAEYYSYPQIVDGEVSGAVVTFIDITERKRTEEALKKYSHDLNERIKELNCLYTISELVRKEGLSQEEVFQKSTAIIARAYMYPEIAACRIIWRDHQYSTENFKKTPWSQECAIMVHGKQVGTIEVCYLEERPEEYEGPFLAEERKFLNNVADLLGKSTERKQTEEEREKLILELQDALSKIKVLSGFLPTCSFCKKIRNDKGEWEQIETYIRDRSEAQFSHGICPECMEKRYPEYSKAK